jgi:hypothetical protein
MSFTAERQLMVGDTAHVGASPPRASAGSWLRPVCERLISALDLARRDPDRDPLASRVALRHAVSAYVAALRAEGISSPWVLESVVAFARACRPRRATAQRLPDPVEADVVRWSLAALDWPRAAGRG